MASMLTKVQAWLSWTQSMRPKPTKCRAVAFRRFEAGSTAPRLQSTQYSAYDPELAIGGQPIPCLWDKEFVFKFLGWWFQADLGDDQVRAKIEQKFSDLLKAIDGTLLNGMCKLWLYEHLAVTKMSWVLMVHDLPLSWVDSHIAAPAARSLKKWSQLAYPANCNIFFRAKEHFGLHLTHMSEFFKKLQAVRHHLLKHSADDVVRACYAEKEARHANESDGLRSRWRATKALTKAEAAVSFSDMVGPIQIGRHGIGFGRPAAEGDPRRDHRRRVTAQMEADAECVRFAEEADHTVQGSWQKWADMEQQDVSWRRLAFSMSSGMAKFLLNATQDTCATPANLQRWQQIQLGRCKLCDVPGGCLQHILNCCVVALEEGRFLWRHDSVLLVLEQTVRIAIKRASAVFRRGGRERASNTVRFVKAGEAPPARRQPKAEHRRETMLELADDWQCQFDLQYDSATGQKRHLLFPPDILATAQLPDGIIWSVRTRRIIILELTCPWEERSVEAHVAKVAKYNQLQLDLEMADWKVQRLTFEVGSRGYLSQTVGSMLAALGLSRAEIKSARGRLSDTALLCSYVIYLCRGSRPWPRRDLMRKYLLCAAPDPPASLAQQADPLPHPASAQGRTDAGKRAGRQPLAGAASKVARPSRQQTPDQRRNGEPAKSSSRQCAQRRAAAGGRGGRPAARAQTVRPRRRSPSSSRSGTGGSASPSC
jgi:hypothetical protein